MTLSEITYNVLNVLRGGRSFNNEHYSEEQLKFNIEYYRALLIRRDIDRNTRFTPFEQDLGFPEVEMVDPAEGFSMTVNGQILQTVEEIPVPLRLKDETFGLRTYLTNRQYAIPVIEFNEARWQQYNKFTATKMRAYYLNDKVCVIGNRLVAAINAMIDGTITDLTEAHILENLNQINIRGIFENPREAFEFSTGTEFDDDSTPYPLPFDYVQRITQSLLSGEFKMMASAPLDTKPNQVPDEKV